MADQPIPKMASAGRPEAIDLITGNSQPITSTPVDKTPPATPATPPNVDVPRETPTDKPADTPVQLTDEQIKTYLSGKGIDFDGNYDALKEKLKPVPAEPTPEEKAQKEMAFEKRMLEFYMNNGGKPEDFVTIKQIASADLTELSKSDLKKELKEAGFKDAEIDLIVKERYYQLEDSELEQYEDETEKEFLKRKKEYGAKKLATRSSHIKTRAEEILSGLKNAIASEDLLEQKEVEFSSKVDEHFKNMPRKITFELGKVNDTEIPPVEYEVADAELADIMDTLKNPDKRKQFFFNSDNSLNLTNIGQVMVRNKILETAMKNALLEGAKRQVQELEKVFPFKTPHEIGIGGAINKQGQKGKMTTYGKPEVAVRQT